MANTKSIREALDQLFDEVTQAEALADAFMNLHASVPSEPPLRDQHAWVIPVSGQIKRLSLAAELLMTLVTQRALPVLDDMESLSRAK